MGSYNYLGYAENEGSRIDSVQSDIPKMGVGLSSAPNELGMFVCLVLELLSNHTFLQTQVPTNNLSILKKKLLNFWASKIAW